nr:protein ALP1-like [Tanacetum cinerariifolium]
MNQNQIGRTVFDIDEESDAFTVATDPKHTYFKQRQESARKDVELAFGVLQGRWGLIQQPARAYEVNTLHRI